VTIAPPSETVVAPAIEVEPPPLPPAGIDVDLLRRMVLRVVLVVLVVALAAVSFETLVAQKYFQVRQSQLFSNWLGPQPHLAIGGAAAILQIPRTTGSAASTPLDLNVVVVQGDGASQLHGGPGHVPNTPLPGRRGNSIIVGHRDGWGGPFGALASVHRGAFILTQTHGSRKATAYTVTTIKYVSASDTRYTGQTKDFRLTLITSDGGMLSNDRLLIQAVSGKPYPAPRGHGPEITIPHASLYLNAALAIALAAFLLAGLAGSYMRRRYALAARLAVLVPVLVAGTFAVMLLLDLLLPPLR